MDSFITDHDTYLFKEGSHFKLYGKLGAHVTAVDGRPGVHFAVWAPNAKNVSVIGNFNKWQKNSHPLMVKPCWSRFCMLIGLCNCFDDMDKVLIIL